jgi:hypothetical protein
MNARFSTTRKFRRLLTNLLSIFAILAIALPVTQVAYAASSSPFVGYWKATDVDGSAIRLTIGGPPSGPFRITWLDSYMSFCGGKPGIVRGTGQRNESNPNLLEAELHLKCFKSRASLDFHFVWRYHPMTGTLSSRYDNGFVIIWRRSGRPLPSPPALGLRVNYGHDWVESFYEGGHTAWITVTDSDGVTVKATAELVTEPKDFWGGDTGFQTRVEDWVPAPPDIQPNDWVFGWVDNGASGQVQIGEINGAIDLDADSIRGTVLSDWFAEELYIICDPWGLSDLNQYRESSVYPDGVDEFECSWSGVLDILPGQELGVWYYGPDGHAVVNAFSTPNIRFTVFPEQNYLEGYEWPDGAVVSISVAGKDACSTEVVSGYPEWDPSNTFFSVNFTEGCTIGTGDLVTLSSGTLSLAHQIQELDIVDVNLDANTVAGTAAFDPEDYILHTWIHEVDGSYMQLSAEGETWLADFGSQGFDLQPGMGGRVELVDQSSNATAVEWNIPSPRLIAFPAADQIFGYNWPEGSEVSLTVNGEYIVTANVQAAPWDPNDIMALFDFGGVHNLVAEDVVTLSGSGMELTYTVQNLSVTEVNEQSNTVSGTADDGALVYAGVHEWWNVTELQLTAEDGTWLADFGSIGFDLAGGMCGRAEIRDGMGSSTAVDWCLAIPVIMAHPAYEVIEGSGWMPGAEVTITVDDPTNGEGTDYSATQIVGDDTWIRFSLLAFDLRAGHIITMTDGHHTQMMAVSTLRVTKFDLDGHTVYGVGDPGSECFLADNGLTVPVDDEGNWSATFDTLLPGSWWTIIQNYPDGNEMRETFRAPLPAMIAWKNWDDVAGSEWTPGAEVTLTIDDPTNGQGVDYTYNKVAVDSDNLYYGEVYFEPEIELQTGYVLTMTDGNFTKTLVLSALTVTGFDFDNHIVHGTGDSGAKLLVHIGGLDSDWITVGEDLNWSVYHQLLEPGVWLDAIQPDEDGDHTRDGGQAL